MAGFGRVAGELERRVYVDDRARGVIFTTILVAGSAGIGRTAERRSGLAHTLLTAAATWAVLGGRSLEREAHAVGDHLTAGDLPAAQQRLTHLVGRDTSVLDDSGVARAVVESVAENTSDAVVAPLWWGGLLGIPGLLGYRAANTLDAMVGHRSPRYLRFGWASARFDDLLNWIPARLTALLAVLLGGSPSAAWRAWRRDSAGHPSPNAGPVEAAFAGALGVQLGGVNVYEGVIEDRHTLGDGPPAEPRDISRATRLASAVGLGALAVSLAAARRRTKGPTSRLP